MPTTATPKYTAGTDGNIQASNSSIPAGTLPTEGNLGQPVDVTAHLEGYVMITVTAGTAAPAGGALARVSIFRRLGADLYETTASIIDTIPMTTANQVINRQYTLETGYYFVALGNSDTQAIQMGITLDTFDGFVSQ